MSLMEVVTVRKVTQSIPLRVKL